MIVHLFVNACAILPRICVHYIVIFGETKSLNNSQPQLFPNKTIKEHTFHIKNQQNMVNFTNVYETSKMLIGKTIQECELLVDDAGELGIIIKTTKGEIYSTVEGNGVELITKEKYQELKDNDKSFYG